MENVVLLGEPDEIAAIRANAMSRLQQRLDLERRDDRVAIALLENTSFEFIETPLVNVIDYLKELHKIEIQVDNRCLEDVGIGTDTPITRNLRGVSLGRALRLILHDMDLAYVVRDEVLLITSAEDAHARPVARVYPLDGLVSVRESGGRRQLEGNRLVRMLTAVVAPREWREAGGAGAISVITAGPARSLPHRRTPPRTDSPFDAGPLPPVDRRRDHRRRTRRRVGPPSSAGARGAGHPPHVETGWHSPASSCRRPPRGSWAASPPHSGLDPGR